MGVCISCFVVLLLHSLVSFHSQPQVLVVLVPRPHVKTREGSGHQAYPDVSPRNVNCACPYT